MEHDLSNKLDIIIIGSGVAGALVAKKLAQAGQRVGILEAGDTWQRDSAVKRYHASSNRNLTAPYKQADWTLTPADPAYFAKQGNQQYQPSYLKGVGGTTWHWTGITPRFLPADFRLQSDYGKAVDWPISYQDLEPYYVQAEHHLGVSGNSTDDHGSPRSRAYPMPAIPMTYADKLIAQKLRPLKLKLDAFPAARNSRDYDGRPACQGNNTCTPLCPIGASYSANTDIEKAIEAGASLIKKAVVYRFETDEAQHITGACFKHPDGSEHIIRAPRFVIACNSIETPRLLLMSANKTWPQGIANGSGMLGRNLMDHAIFVTTFEMPEPLYIGRGPQSVSTILTGRDGSFRHNFAAAKFFLGNDLNVHQEVAKLLKDDASWIDPLNKLRSKMIHQGQIGAEVEQLPDKNNRISIDKSRLDPLGLPLPLIDYKLATYTQQGLNHWIEYADMLIGKMHAKSIDHHQSLSSHHPCGTTRMGDDAKASVVNRHCQSHDHQNLFIIGSSVFPTMGTANPTLTIAALSLRLADHLLKTLPTNT